MPALSPAYPVVFTDQTTIDGTTYLGGYCSVQDVKNLLYNIANDPLLLTNTLLIESMISDNARDIDRALETMYVTPITGTNSVEHMRYINKYMALADLITLSTGSASVGSDGGVHPAHATASIHRETGSQRLDEIVLGTVILFDAVTSTTGERPAFPQGKAAGWNPDVDATAYLTPDPTFSTPLFGVRNNPPLPDDSWVY